MLIEEQVQAMARGLESDPGIARRAQRLTLRLLLAADDEAHVLDIRDGRVVSVRRDAGPMHDWDLAMRMSGDDWQGFWQAAPRPGWHDIFALTRGGRLRIEGDHLPLMQNLQVIKDILALGRNAATVSA